MRAARTKFCLKIGLVPAFCAALLPMVVALFHLMPVMMMPGMDMAMAMAPAPAANHAPAHQAAAHDGAHHDHDHHGDAVTEREVAAVEQAAAIDEDCHPPGEPCDDPPPHRMGPSCPLCLWLQGFHALPAPVALALRLPSTRAVVVERIYEAPVVRSVTHSTSQPRAPPISPAV